MTKILKVKIRPKAPKNEIKGEMADGTLKVDIAALPEKGDANRELISFLARKYKVDVDDIKISSGKKSKLKLIKIKSL
ncbi:hypothetical protein GF382_02525 [Candidatus Falkowbacteria bacterium]|nr:hypothetical protein [Candidatus Falkowbacteria bacterium]